MLNQITEDMKTAMKAKDKARLGCIRLMRSALKDKEIELGHRDLTDAEAVAVLSRLVKQRNDAASQYVDAGRADLQAIELAEITIIQAYLPEPLSDDELIAMVDQAIRDSSASSMRDMGKVMGMVKSRAEGRADMGKISGIVKSRLG